jgi:hypothetical protein
MLTIAMAAVLTAPLARGAESVHLTVGYQPYDTISYSAVVIRGLELWKKHLPPGSTVDFESALQGAIIVNAMLADKQQIGYLGDMPAVVSTTKINKRRSNLWPRPDFRPDSAAMSSWYGLMRQNLERQKKRSNGSMAKQSQLLAAVAPTGFCVKLSK